MKTTQPPTEARQRNSPNCLNAARGHRALGALGLAMLFALSVPVFLGTGAAEHRCTDAAPVTLQPLALGLRQGVVVDTLADQGRSTYYAVTATKRADVTVTLQRGSGLAMMNVLQPDSCLETVCGGENSYQFQTHTTMACIVRDVAPGQTVAIAVWGPSASLGGGHPFVLTVTEAAA